MTSALKASMKALKVQAAQIAKLSGDPNKLASREIAAAERAGEISKAQRDLLQRALSDAPNGSVPAVAAQLDRYEQAFERAQTDDEPGRISKAEAVTAEENWRNWAALARSPNVPQVEKDAAQGKTVQVDWMSSGRRVTAPISSPGSLLTKVDRVVEESIDSLFASNAAALAHQTEKNTVANLVA